MRKASPKGRNETVAAIDIGSTKVSCCIARLGEDKSVDVAGIGHQVSRGLRRSIIVDMEAVEISILNAVHTAEQMAGETIKEVFVNVPSGQQTSHKVNVEVGIDGQMVEEKDIRKLLTQLHTGLHDGEGEILHTLPIGFSLDENKGIRDPRGMYGERLGADIHLITAPASALRNLAACVGRCHLDIAGFVASPLASGLATLVEDEMELGVILVDMGGGATSLAGFSEGVVVFTDSVLMGGLHVTHDIARGLSTSVAYAERLKTLYGCALASPSDDRESILVPQVGEDEATQANQIPKSQLINIIQPRLEETFEHIAAKLEALASEKWLGRRVVLTGGASQISGVREMASHILRKQVRLGRPLYISGLKETSGGPSFATCAGMLNFAQKEYKWDARRGKLVDHESQSRWGRLGKWLRENI